MALEIQKKYLLGEYELDAGSHSLVRSGTPIPLSRKRFQVLLYLLEERHRLVSRQELLERFWDGHEVYEENLTKCVSEIRKALADQTKPHKFIETVPAVGYRYIGPLIEEALQPSPSTFEIERTRGVKIVVEEDDGQNAAVATEQTLPGKSPARLNGHVRPAGLGKSSWLRPAVLAGVIVAVATGAFIIHRSSTRTAAISSAPIRSIAVLPFKNLSGDQAEEYFSDGMTESLITALSKIDGLKVISRGSTFRYKGNETSPPEIGKQLGVAAVLEGSVRKNGDSVRVAVRLVSAEDGRVLWSNESNDRKISDVFSLQDEIANHVVAGLRVKLSEEGAQRLAKRYTDNVEAYQLYLRGRFHWDRWTLKESQKSIEYFQQAINLDPGYALAYAGLADAYFALNGLGGASASEVRPKATAAALRAAELDDNLAEAHTALGVIKDNYDWDFAGAEREFRRAAELNSNLSTAHHLYGKFLPDMTGGFDEASAELQRALELDPLSPGINKDLGEHLYYSRQYDRAIEQFKKTLELEPNYSAIYYWLERCYEAKGLYDQAIEAAQKGGEIGGVPPETLAAEKQVYVASGWKGYWQKRIALAIEGSKQKYYEPYHIALMYVRLGKKEQALDWLETAYQGRSGWMPSIKYDPELDSLRSDPRFADLERRVGLALQVH